MRLTAPVRLGHPNTDVPSKPRQIEFARLGINYTVMSKRKLRKLVEEDYVSRLGRPPHAHPVRPAPTGLYPRLHPQFLRPHRRGEGHLHRGVCLLEHCLREDLNEHAQRAMAVLHPIKLTITNYPEGQGETLEVENNPNDPGAGTCTVSFSRHLYLESDDFLETPVPKYKRPSPAGLSAA